jgi:hypothetical protein
MDDQKKVSFRQKNASVCPICAKEFYREELLTGGGRLIAGKLTMELRRNYEESKKFGRINPLIYVLSVCPGCLYASYQKDFTILLESEKEKLRELTAARKNVVKKFFGEISFDDERNLQTGAASYMLAIDCYSFRNKKVAPTFKNAVCSIRAAWLFGDLAKEYPERQYDKISQFFYKKAYIFYTRVLELAQTGDESSDAAGNMGPDTDKNWGYDGILYMMAVLTVKVGGLDADINKRIENFERCKRYLSRLFGIGKTSKNRPGELLDKTKGLYDVINSKLEEWKREAGEKFSE